MIIYKGFKMMKWTNGIVTAWYVTSWDYNVHWRVKNVEEAIKYINCVC